MLFSTLLVTATAVGLSVLPASGRSLNRSMVIEQPSNANNASLSGLSGMLPDVGMMQEQSHANKQPVAPSGAALNGPRACCSTGAPVCDPWC
ncbi:hypothetical protein Moror_1634 [Moniliophthora roreri MCA 2997]|uniref:Secreted protein n=1 Tax=Moniliophthora roreri (strain MCA 2997) TaxID=1381753 RepID=V2XKZ9_MONRO|nr:hypothetical protein Moror_1634 [Moniliophthora roreri MCA 2997]